MIIDRETVISSSLLEESFHFWFNDNGHIRSPFPAYIHPMLQHDATERFLNWVDGLHEDAKDELNDEAIAEKFEEIIFEEATKLVRSEDEKLTILYPFLPRLGDHIFQNEAKKEGESIIVERSLIKEGDDSFMKVVLENTADGQQWDTMFQLPSPIE